MRPDKFRKRPGTTDEGKDYENILVAYYSLKFVLNDDIADFKISSNDDKHGSFDDLVIQVIYTNREKEQFNIQAKHKQTNKNKTLLLQALAAENGKFSVKKRLQEIKDNQDGSRYILFTNRPLQISDDKKLILEEEHFYIFIVRAGDHHLVSTAAQGVFNISIEEKNVKNKEAWNEIKQYKRLSSNFYFFTNQKNVKEVQEAVLSLFQEKFKCDANIAKNYVKFIKDWSDRDGKKNKLDKEFLQLKIAELLLTPYILIPSFDVEENEKSNLLRKAIDSFDITVTTTDSRNNFYRIKHKVDIDTLNKTARKYHVLPEYVLSESEISSLQRNILMWILNKQPLMVKVTSSNETSIFQAVRRCSGQKKFILVGTKKQHPELLTFRNLTDLYIHCKEIYKQVVQKFSCAFNGQKEVTLEKIIGNEEKIRSAFSTDELILMLDETGHFGSSKIVIPNFYLERRLTKITIDFKFIEKNGDNSHILVSGNTKLKRLKSLLPDAKYLTPEQGPLNSPVDSSIEFFGKCLYIADQSYAKEAFRIICENNPCHHFCLDDDGELLWLQSSQNVNTLTHFATKSNHFVKEFEVPGTSKLHIICADAGMGKSMMMSNLKNSYSSDCWVLKILLREYICFFEKKVHHEEFFEHLSQQLKLSMFEQKVFDSFKTQGKIILMWDGIDEINKEVFENVLYLIEDLKTEDFVQWITARSNLKQVLEEKLNTLSRKIEPFERKEQKEFIKKRLHDDELKDTIDEILQKVDDALLRIPLQLFMLTELYRKNNTICKNLLTQKFSIIDLFEFLVEEAFDFYYKKSNIDVNSNNIAKQIVEEHKVQRMECYQIVALHLCLHPTIVATFKLPSIENFIQKVKQEGDSFGIIEIVNNTPSFSHQTYVEYFVALWLSMNFTKIENLQSFFFDESFKGVRFMFDLILSKNCPVHKAVLHKSVEGVVKNLNQVNLKDEAGRNPLHIASSWGQSHVPLTTQKKGNKTIVVTEKRIFPNSESGEILDIFNILITKCDITEKDRLLRFDCLQYADRSLSLAALDSFAQRMRIDFQALQNFKSLESVLYYIVKFDYGNLHRDLIELPYIETVTGGSLLHLCAAHNRQQILPKLFNNKMYPKNINKRDHRKWAPVHHAVHHGHLEMLKMLKEKGADIHLGSSTGEETPLFVAAKCGHLQILDYLLKNGGDMNISKKDGWTPLLVAIQRSKIQIVKYLVNHKADVNKPNKNGYGPLHVAARKGDFEVVKFLVLKKANVNMVGKNGETPLFVAAKLGFLDVAKLLVRHGGNVNAVKTNGWTPLAIATKSGDLPMVKLLLENRARWDATIRSSKLLNPMSWKIEAVNPLKIAIEKNYPQIEKLLGEYGVRNILEPRIFQSAPMPIPEAQALLDKGANSKTKEIIISILIILVFVLIYCCSNMVRIVMDKLWS